MTSFSHLRCVDRSQEGKKSSKRERVGVCGELGSAPAKRGQEAKRAAGGKFIDSHLRSDGGVWEREEGEEIRGSSISEANTLNAEAL